MCWDRMNQIALASGRFPLRSPHHHSKWFQYVGELACITDGTWYSTQAKGECTGVIQHDKCWWRLAETHRTVNASCVDDSVVKAVKERRPQCWSACPEPSNRTSACYLECLFETLVGNSTKGIRAMTREEITKPFVDAFKTEQSGGCGAALCAVDDDCRVHGDKTAYCNKHSGWCRCGDPSKFGGQFCRKAGAA